MLYKLYFLTNTCTLWTNRFSVQNTHHFLLWPVSLNFSSAIQLQPNNIETFVSLLRWCSCRQHNMYTILTVLHHIYFVCLYDGSRSTDHQHINSLQILKRLSLYSNWNMVQWFSVGFFIDVHQSKLWMWTNRLRIFIRTNFK